MTNSNSIQDVLFFPQMRPQKKVRVVELDDEEKSVLAYIKSKEKAEIGAAKSGYQEAHEISNKKWDKAIKKLREEKLIAFSKNEQGEAIIEFKQSKAYCLSI